MCPGYIFPIMKEPITEFEFVTSALKQYYRMAEQAYICGGAYKVEFIISPNRMLYIRIYTPSIADSDGWKMSDHFDVSLGHAEAFRWNLGKLEEFTANIITRYSSRS